MRQLKIPKIWRRALVVAIPKPEKPLGDRDPKSYHPISLLCVPFKILARLIYARVETITVPLLPQEWADHQWNAEWADNLTRLHTSIPDTGTHTPGMTLPRRAWVRFSRLRTGVGRFRSCLYKWHMASSAACECGAEQTVDHVILRCPILRSPHGLHGLTVLDDETTEWLLNTCPDI